MPLNLTTNAIGYINSPIGWLKVCANQSGLTSIDFDATPEPSQGNIHTQQAVVELTEYFAGQRQVFSVPLRPSGTKFQQNVWQALTRIPFGKTCSYLDIALAINNPKAVRAVGAANGRNPIPIIVPCHRVIGRDGSLIGFSGGLDKKEWLLKHEGALLI